MIDDKATQTLENLHRMKAEGMITEEDYERSKERILFGPAAIKKEAALSNVPPPRDDIVAWLKRPWLRWADYQGRSGRREFWTFQLIPAAIGIIVVVIAGMGGDEYGNFSALQRAIAFLAVLAMLALIVPQLALQVRRFHDQDKSGWFVLLNAIPYIGPFIVLAMMLVPSSPGDNRYGPSEGHS